MKWFLKILHQYADFSGRARRREYWFALLFIYLLGIMPGMVDVLIMNYFNCPPILTLLWLFAMIIPMLAVAVRRLHDIGKSGWFILVGMIPCIGGVILLIWFCTDSVQDENKWGKNPKQKEYNLF